MGTKIDFPEHINELIKSNSVFKHLDDEQILELSQEVTHSQYKKGTELYREGNRSKGVYCVLAGVVKIFKTGLEGKNQIIKFAKSGDIIGYRSVLSEELACSSAKVIEEANICFIPTDSLTRLINSSPGFTKEMLLMSCNELGEANAFITEIAQKSVKERLAEALVILKKDFGLDKNRCLDISLTREELANIVGTATESIIRLLSEFKNDNLIELQGRKIRIIDLQGLIRISGMY